MSRFASGTFAVNDAGTSRREPQSTCVPLPARDGGRPARRCAVYGKLYGAVNTPPARN